MAGEEERARLDLTGQRINVAEGERGAVDLYGFEQEWGTEKEGDDDGEGEEQPLESRLGSASMV